MLHGGIMVTLWCLVVCVTAHSLSDIDMLVTPLFPCDQAVQFAASKRRIML